MIIEIRAKRPWGPNAVHWVSPTVAECHEIVALVTRSEKFGINRPDIKDAGWKMRFILYTAGWVFMLSLAFIKPMPDEIKTLFRTKI
jgi:hypothetical protein